VPEVIDDGVTGYICEDIEDAVAALARLDALSRAEVRRTFEHRFTAARMATDYVAAYRRQLEVPHDARELATAP
jgi:glycosyltransferase involved in cell wall biosynthesis